MPTHGISRDQARCIKVYFKRETLHRRKNEKLLGRRSFLKMRWERFFHASDGSHTCLFSVPFFVSWHRQLQRDVTSGSFFSISENVSPIKKVALTEKIIALLLSNNEDAQKISSHQPWDSRRILIDCDGCSCALVTISGSMERPWPSPPIRVVGRWPNRQQHRLNGGSCRHLRICVQIRRRRRELSTSHHIN